MPRLTLRPNTERPITVEAGTNRVVGNDPGAIMAAFDELAARDIPSRRPERWDGHASERIAEILSGHYAEAAGH